MIGLRSEHNKLLVEAMGEETATNVLTIDIIKSVSQHPDFQHELDFCAEGSIRAFADEVIARMEGMGFAVSFEKVMINWVFFLRETLSQVNEAINKPQKH